MGLYVTPHRPESCGSVSGMIGVRIDPSDPRTPIAPTRGPLSSDSLAALGDAGDAGDGDYVVGGAGEDEGGTGSTANSGGKDCNTAGHNVNERKTEEAVVAQQQEHINITDASAGLIETTIGRDRLGKRIGAACGDSQKVVSQLSAHKLQLQNDQNATIAAARRKYLVRRNSDVVHDNAEQTHVLPSSFSRPQLIGELMHHIRRAFLEVVRVSYWRQINSGKLPRKSSATLILLNSIDVALENISGPGLHDWQVIEAKYRHYFTSQRNRVNPLRAVTRVISHSMPPMPNFVAGASIKRSNSSGISEKAMAALSGPTPVVEGATSLTGSRKYVPLCRINGKEEAARDAEAPPGSGGVEGGDGDGDGDGNASDGFGGGGGAEDSKETETAHPPMGGAAATLAQIVRDHNEAQIVYLLTAFIDAHHYAQKRIPTYLGDTDTIDTPEEALVVQESRAVVALAKARLAAIDPQVVTVQVSKQTARWIVHRQEDQIELFVQEGILTERDAEALFEEAERDLHVLGKVDWTDVLSTVSDQAAAALYCPGLWGGTCAASAGGAAEVADPLHVHSHHSHHSHSHKSSFYHGQVQVQVQGQGQGLGPGNHGPSSASDGALSSSRHHHTNTSANANNNTNVTSFVSVPERRAAGKALGVDLDVGDGVELV
jgi:hypothetical protein